MSPMAAQFLAAVLHMVGAVCVLGYFTAGAIGTSATEATEPLTRRWLWIGLGILVLTGLWMLERWHVTFPQVMSGDILVSRFGQVLLLKLLVAAAVVGGTVMIRRQGALARWGLLLAACLVAALSAILVR